MLEFLFGVACGAKPFLQCTPSIIFSFDFEICAINMLQFTFGAASGDSKFLRITTRHTALTLFVLVGGPHGRKVKYGSFENHLQRGKPVDGCWRDWAITGFFESVLRRGIAGFELYENAIHPVFLQKLCAGFFNQDGSQSPAPLRGAQTDGEVCGITIDGIDGNRADQCARFVIRNPDH